MRSFLAQRPNLPPQQSSEHQVKIGGQICLACASGGRMRPQHEQATPRKRGDPPAHQFPEPSLYPVANHRRANRTANNKAYLRPCISWYRTGGQQQSTGNNGAARPATRAQRTPELIRPSHPRLLRQHHTSCAAKAARHGTRRPLSGRVRPRAARGPFGGAQPARRGRPWYASAGGSRGPSPADGYSAGTCACSLELQYGSETVTGQARSCRLPRGRTQVDSPVLQPPQPRHGSAC
jgi:hypothetical protein